MRKLAYCAGGFSAAIFLAHFLLPARWVLPGALAAVVLALVTLLLPGQTRRRVMAALLSAAIGFGWYAAASALRLTPAQNVSGDVQTVTARVTEYPVAYARSYGLTALLTSPDVPNCKARLYVSDADAAALRPGDEITAENSAVVAKCFEVIAKLAAQEGLTGGYRVISNCGDDAGQTVHHLHFHFLGGAPMGEKLL